MGSKLAPRSPGRAKCSMRIEGKKNQVLGVVCRADDEESAESTGTSITVGLGVTFVNWVEFTIRT